MPSYELIYVEIRRYEPGGVWVTASDHKTLPLGELGDAKIAESHAKAFLAYPSDDELVVSKIPVKLVQVIDVRW